MTTLLYRFRLTFALFFAVVLILKHNSAIAVTYNQEAILAGVALDTSPVDGVFDNLRLDGNFIEVFKSELGVSFQGVGRGLMEFDIQGIPANANVQSASLDLFSSTGDQADVSIFGYQGDGQITLSDAIGGTFIDTVNLPTQSSATLDVTSFIADSLGSSSHIGFRGQLPDETTPPDVRLTIGTWPDPPSSPGLVPVLTVEYVPTIPRTVVVEANADSFVAESEPITNYGASEYLRVGNQADPGGFPNSPVSGKKRSFVRFDVSAIPEGVRVDNAVFGARQGDSVLTDGFRVLEISQDWNEASITWDNQPSTNAELGVMLLSQGPVSFASDELNSLVDSWIRNANSNHGIAFLVLDELGDNNPPGSSGDTLFSREWNTPPTPPTLTLTLGLAGDYNRNGTVDAADYTVWRDNLGATGLTAYAMGDGTGDGNVTAEDYDVWQSQFGMTVDTAAVSESSAVPEPSGTMLLCICCCSLGRVVRRRGRD